MSNRFAQFDDPLKSAGNSKNKKKAELAKKLAEGNDVPLLNQRTMVEGQKLKGFATVEKNKNSRPKGKPRAKTEYENDGAQAVVSKPKPAPKRKGPLGGDVISEDQIKAEKKALQQQKKTIASQRVKVNTGDAVTAGTKKANDAKIASAKAKKEEEKGAQKPKNTQHVAAHTPANDDEEVEAGPHDDDLEKLQKKSSNAAKKAAKKAKHVDAFSMPPRAAPKAKPAAGGSVHIAAAERQSATNHEHLADGSVVAMVKFCFVNGSKTQALVGGKGMDEAVKVVAENIKKSGTVKGGYYIVVEGKHFSDESTIDEPWMVESYFKALLALLRDNKKEGIAYPFWPVAGPGKKAVDTAEAQVKMHITGETLHLEHCDHGYTVKASCKKAKVSLKHFVRDIVKHGALLVQLKAKVAEQMTAGNEQKVDVLGAKLEQLVDELSQYANLE